SPGTSAPASPRTTSGPAGAGVPSRQATPTRITLARPRRTQRAASASVRVAAATVSAPASGRVAVVPEPADRAVQGGVHRAGLEAELAHRLLRAREHQLARHVGTLQRDDRLRSR